MSDTLPANWPESVPLPTMEEAEEAVRQMGKALQAAEAERRKHQPCVCMRLGLRHGPWCPDWEEKTDDHARQ